MANPSTTLAALQSALADRYRIEREIGSGGMATVYLAYDLKHERRVAIKVLRPTVSEVIGATRFLAEIRTTANLHHPHILPLHDSGQAGDLLYYVMPFMDGVSLHERIRTEGPLPVGETVNIAKQVASALEYAHRQGVVHRDIKPENILVQGDQAFVADFGIALVINAADADRLTITGILLGTPQYMSPEHVQGEATLDPRSDIYSLGVTMYEALTGEPPFTGPTAHAVIAKVLTHDPVPPSRRRAGLSAELDAAVMTAIARDPARRFQTAAAMGTALSARGVSGTEMLNAEPARVRRRLTIGAAVVVVLALALAGYAAIRLMNRAVPSARASRAVVALPFENHGPDSVATAYLADGLPEDLLGTLANAPNLSVRPMPREARFRTRPDLQTAGRELHADIVLTGALLVQGDSIRLTVRPYDVASNSYLASIAFTAAKTNLFGLEDSVARAIAARLNVGVASQSRMASARRARSVNSAAHDTLLLARWFAEKRSCASLDRTVELLTHATRIDSTYAQAWADLAQDRVLRAAFMCVRGIDEFVLARAAVGRALDLDPNLADAHVTLGFLHVIADWDWPRARAEFDRAIALDPSKSDVWLFNAWYYVAVGRMDSARASVRQALSLDPTSSIIRTRVGSILGFSDSTASAASEVQAVLDRQADFEPARVEMATLDIELNRCSEALALSKTQPRAPDGASEKDAVYIYADGVCGNAPAARAALKTWELRLARGEFVTPFQMAIGYAGVDDDAKVLSWLNRAVDERDWQVWELAVYPAFRKYHRNPAFQALVQRVHLPPVTS